MQDVKFDIEDLDLDEGGMFHELTITHLDGCTSFILSDDELTDLYKKAMDRYLYHVVDRKA